MLKIENWEVVGWEHTIRGMRNPMNSWDKSDTVFEEHELEDWPHDRIKTFNGVGPNDLKLMKKLAEAGTDHRKFMRFIDVYLDITAPLYWWKEFDTYRAGAVPGEPYPNPMEIDENSCSTMHKIHEKEFTLDDFSCEHLIDEIPEEPVIDVTVRDGITVCIDDSSGYLAVVAQGNYHEDHSYRDTLLVSPKDILNMFIIPSLNANRKAYLKTKDKKYWWQMIQLLPDSYNQKRTLKLNYEVLANMYKSRRNHKLDEWHVVCDWIEMLPYSELITGKE